MWLAFALAPSVVLAQSSPLNFLREECLAPSDIPPGRTALLPPSEQTTCVVGRTELKLSGGKRVGLLTNVFATPGEGTTPASQQQLAVVGLLNAANELKPLEWIVASEYPSDGVQSLNAGRAAGEDFVELRIFAGVGRVAKSRVFLLRDDRLVRLDDRVVQSLSCKIPTGYLPRQGVRYDLKRLRGSAAMYRQSDGTCCPSAHLEIELRIQGDQLTSRRCVFTKDTAK